MSLHEGWGREYRIEDASPFLNGHVELPFCLVEVLREAPTNCMGLVENDDHVVSHTHSPEDTGFFGNDNLPVVVRNQRPEGVLVIWNSEAGVLREFRLCQYHLKAVTHAVNHSCGAEFPLVQLGSFRRTHYLHK